MYFKSQHLWITEKGFTVIELLVIVALLGIILSVAIPSYQDKTMRANRADALVPMQQILVAQERYYTNNRVYTRDFTQLGYDNSTLALDEYIVSARSCSSTKGDLPLFECVEIVATAQGSQIADGNIILNTQGRSEREVTQNGQTVYESI